MRIKRLTIKNLGKHKQIDVELGGSVIGLLGKNAAGKSTILKLLHFLMTGYTPAKENQDSFIRRTDPEIEVAPEWGSVEAEFSAHGAHCVLSRRLGHGSNRKLTIDDKTYTRADDIQAALTDIIGADKYAIDNAVFPAQGELNNVLFGSQADREELLVKMLLLGHMQKVADVAAGKIKMLASEIQDFSVLQDELTSSRRAAEEGLALTESQLSKATNYNTEVKQYTDITRLEGELKQLHTDKRETQNRISSNETSIITALANFSQSSAVPVNSVAELQGWYDKLIAKINKTREDKTSILNVKMKCARYHELKNRAGTTEAELKTLKASMPKPVPASEIQAMTAACNKQRERTTAKDKLSAARTSLMQITAEQTNFTEESAKVKDQLTRATDTWNVLNTEVALYNTIVETCNLVLHGKSCAIECPVCRSDIGSLDLNKRRDDAQAKCNELNDKISTAHKEVIAKSTQTTGLAGKISRAAADIERLSVEIKNYEAILLVGTDIDLKKEEANISTATENNNKFYTMTGTEARLTKECAEIDKELAVFSTTEVQTYEQISIPTLDANIAKADIDLKRWLPISETMSELLRQCSTLTATIEANNTGLDELDKRIDANQRQHKSITDNFSPRLKSIIASGCDVANTLNAKNHEFVELQVKAKQLRIQTDAIKKRLQEIDAKIQLDADKRDVIAELQRIISAFSRQGIPMAYVQHKFDGLVAMTQENLEIMDANFAIIPNPDKPVSLQFYRVDEPGQILFDQEKLSGGQRVRLSIAFLLAVQQLVIPDLGFLVLDEPSTHLDDEAKENLKDLLINLGQQLETTDTQIIVCDHAKELEPAFVNIIKV